MHRRSDERFFIVTYFWDFDGETIRDAADWLIICGSFSQIIVSPQIYREGHEQDVRRPDEQRLDMNPTFRSACFVLVMFGKARLICGEPHRVSVGVNLDYNPAHGADGLLTPSAPSAHHTINPPAAPHRRTDLRVMKTRVSFMSLFKLSGSFLSDVVSPLSASASCFPAVPELSRGRFVKVKLDQSGDEALTPARLNQL